MNVFHDYGKYYDLLYHDKNYKKEADFIFDILMQHKIPSDSHLLELGIGTAKHAYYLAEKGYKITGIEQSQVMLEIADKHLADQSLSQNIQLYQGDIRNWSSEKKYDAAISLFHVMSYMTSLEDVKSVFLNVKQHIKVGGYFIFDCWYGPAVLNLKPEVRFKIMQNDELAIERVAIPDLNVNKQTVSVNYHFFVKDKNTESYKKSEEQHNMRYFFLSEIELICQSFDMEIVDCFEWMTRNPLSEKTWGSCFVIKL